MKALKSFPIGKEWRYEPKWDGFRCLIFRDEESIFLQSRTGKSLTSAFPEIVAAFRALRPNRFVVDGELAMPTKNGFSFDGLVNRLRIGSARLALEVRGSPAIYIVFDMLANSENLLGSPFRLRRKTLERFFEDSVPRSSPLYLSASTEDLREVEKWVGHIGHLPAQCAALSNLQKEKTLRARHCPACRLFMTKKLDDPFPNCDNEPRASLFL
jgi:ATP-dependent DNA ligase